MELTSILALFGIAVGALYLVLAVVAFNRSRGRHAEQPERSGEVVLSIEENPIRGDEPTPDRMRKLAALCASVGSQSFGEQFDYSVESISRLDRAIVSGWGESDEQPEDAIIHSFGAYLGEVLVRRTRGRWVTGLSDSDPANVLFLGPGDDDVVSFSPFMLVREKFAKMYSFDLAIAFTALEQKLKEVRAA